MSVRILTGDCRTMLADLEPESVQCCVTSPPYHGLRDYQTARWEGGDPDCDHRKVQDTVAAVATSTLGGGKKTTGHQQEGYRGQCGRCGAVRIDKGIGLEPTIDEHIAALVDVFRCVWRVLKDDGTVWLNYGDRYWTDSPVRSSSAEAFSETWDASQRASSGGLRRSAARNGVLKNKDLIGLPWRIAFALQADGWYLRSAIVWAKPNPMPESVTDRPTSAYEHIFLLSKSGKYFYDAAAIAEKCDPEQLAHNQRYAKPYDAYDGRAGHTGQPGNVNNVGIHARPGNPNGTRNARNVWTISTAAFSEAHFAVFPPEIPRRCILAGSREGDTVLDPFAGAGTTLLVADRLGRNGVGIEVNPEYVAMAERRIVNDAPLFTEVSA